MPPRRIERLLSPFQGFIHAESSSGILLLLATVLALVWANSAVWETYHHLWETYVGIVVGEWSFRLSLHHFINDGLMVIFFFLVGLEIKREILVGELSSVRAATLPIAAALGGMLVPAGLYVMVNAGGPGAAGWGIPMATDIAFALGILALMGPGVPLGLKVFLAALAIVDDLGAVLVIALFYTAELNLAALGVGGLILLLLIALNRLEVRYWLAYAVLGILLWTAFLESGVHATIAGVLLAMTIPARTHIDTELFLDRGRALMEAFDDAGIEGKNVLTNAGQQNVIQEIENTCENAQAPLQKMEHALHVWVAFLIVPLFALANAGVHLAVDIGEAFTNPVTLGVILGLVVGKPVGVTLFAWASVRMGMASLPVGVDWRALHGVSWLAGIGFTMSLFVANLAFGEGSALLDAAKIGVLSASAVAAVVGWVLLTPVRKRSAPAA